MIKDIVTFYHNASFLADRGANIYSIIEQLKPEGYEVILERLKQGATIGNALKGYIPEEDRLALDAAEQTGRIRQALKILEERHRIAAEATQKIIKTATFPMIFFVVLLLFIIFIITYLAPQVAKALADVSKVKPVELPAYHEFVFKTTTAIHDNPGIAIAVMIPIIILFVVSIFTGFLWSVISRLPLVKPVVDSYRNTVLFSYLYMLVAAQAGFNIALRTISQITHPKIAKDLLLAADQIEKGDPIHQAIAGLWDEFAVKTILVGEETADLPEACKMLAEWYKDKFDQHIQKLEVTLNMSMLITMALFVIWAAYSFYYPIMLLAYQLSS